MNADWASAYWRDRRGSDLCHNGRLHIRNRRGPSAEVGRIRRHLKRLRNATTAQVEMVIRLHRVSA